jgi:heat shock protein HtpX
MFIAPIILASWLFVGTPLPIFIVLVSTIIASISVLRCRLTQKTVALFGLMGLMAIQSIVIVLMMHFQLLHPFPPHLNETAGWMSQELLGLDVHLIEVGVPAAILVGAYIEFVRSRLNLAQAFPTLTFFDKTDDLAMTLERLATSANIECPNLCLVDSGAPCAFTTRSKGKYTIALSIGLLESFDETEVEACLAHEIAHIKNRDFALRTLATVARIALFAKVLSYFVESALYRTRELLADRTAASLIDGPGALISALTKLQEATGLEEPPTNSAICFFEAKRGFFELLSKHPNLNTRIRMLREMNTPRKA